MWTTAGRCGSAAAWSVVTRTRWRLYTSPTPWRGTAPIAESTRRSRSATSTAASSSFQRSGRHDGTRSNREGVLMSIHKYVVREQDGLWEVRLDDRLVSGHPTRMAAVSVAEVLAHG